MKKHRRQSIKKTYLELFRTIQKFYVKTTQNYLELSRNMKNYLEVPSQNYLELYSERKMQAMSSQNKNKFNHKIEKYFIPLNMDIIHLF